MSATTQALAAYRKAVKNTTYWEDHGHRGDGKLEAAQTAEKEARAALLKVIREDRS